MTTPRPRSVVSRVSLVAVLTVTFMLAGCAGSPSRLASDGPAPTDPPPVTVSFVNDAREYVRVYLVGDKDEWFLGRVEPGARATLRIPELALAENPGFLRLAVLEGQRMTVRAGDDARATTSIKQPMAAIVSQQWTFSHTLSTRDLTPGRLGANVGRP